MSNNLGTPRDDDTGGSYLHSFQNENVSVPCLPLSLITLSTFTLNLKLNYRSLSLKSDCRKFLMVILKSDVTLLH